MHLAAGIRTREVGNRDEVEGGVRKHTELVSPWGQPARERFPSSLHRLVRSGKNAQSDSTDRPPACGGALSNTRPALALNDLLLPPASDSSAALTFSMMTGWVSKTIFIFSPGAIVMTSS